MRVYGTAAAMKRKEVVMEMLALRDKALQVKDGPVVLSVFVKHRSDVLKYGNKVQESFADPSERSEWYSAPQISQSRFMPQP